MIDESSRVRGRIRLHARLAKVPYSRLKLFRLRIADVAMANANLNGVHNRARNRSADARTFARVTGTPVLSRR